jgi:LacI family transcriptional regulator
MRTNIKDIAEKSGVSIATVSRVINNKGPVKFETRKKIIQIAKELSYIPNPLARGLSSKQTDTIGVILPELHDEFFMDFVHGIDEEAHRNNRYLLISSSHSQRNDLKTMIEFMSSGRVDGVILMAPGMQDTLSDIIKKSKRPLVLLNCAHDLENVATFNIDNYRGAYLMVEHLINHGYRHLGMIKGPEQNNEARDRYQGFVDALKKYNIPENSHLIMQGDFSLKSGYYGFLRLMGQKVKPESIFMANDMMALGGYDAARNSNINIPHDVAIAGFDDIFSGRIVTPSLTTVHAPINELGRKAMSYLLKMIIGEVDPRASYNEVLSTGLVIGGSCGCMKGN